MKYASGWSLPLRDKNATALYAKADNGLCRYYAHANSNKLYSLIETALGGEASGWSGTFPSSGWTYRDLPLLPQTRIKGREVAEC